MARVSCLLWAVAERRKIDNFVAENFWTLELEYRETSDDGAEGAIGGEAATNRASDASRGRKQQHVGPCYLLLEAQPPVPPGYMSRLFEECLSERYATVVKAVRVTHKT